MEFFRFPYKVPCAAEQHAENRRMLECISRYMHFAAADGRAPYLALRKKERAGVTYRYWIEDTLLCYLDGSLDA